MSHGHRLLASLTSQELDARAAEYRRMAKSARGQDIASALDRLAIRYALLAAHREIEEIRGLAAVEDMTREQDHSSLAKLIASVEQIALDQPNPVKALGQFIRTIAQGNADPYIVIGVLLEGAVHLLSNGIPHERRKDTATAMMLLMANRLRANGLLEEQ